MRHQEFPKRQQLLNTIIEKGILRASTDKPLLTRAGTPMDWVMNMLGLSLESESLTLAAQGMLHLLARFEGRQLATIGTAAVPLMTACILLSKGKYTGLMVRPERKQYGTGNLIDGNINLNEPVIVIDDSIGSGTNMLKCIDALESEGLYVEGGACLVRFHWYTGEVVMLDRGYQLETLYDHRTEISPLVRRIEPSSHQPLLQTQDLNWHPKQVAEGLSPLQLCRQVIEEYLATQLVLRPPQNLSVSVSTPGGCFVSLRSRVNPKVRYARSGFIRFPGECKREASFDLVVAAVRAAQQLSSLTGAKQKFKDSYLSLTLNQALESCELAEMDNQHFALALQSQVRPELHGSALPRMPGIRNSWQQYQHLRDKNAGLLHNEPASLYRFNIKKLYDPDVEPLPGGVAASCSVSQTFDERDLALDVLKYLRRCLNDLIAGVSKAPKEGVYIPKSLDYLFVSLYQNGIWQGCTGSAQCHRDEDLFSLVENTLNDPRRIQPFESCASDDITIVVHFLTESQSLETTDRSDILPVYAHGVDSLSLRQGAKFGLMLPHVAIDKHMTPAEFVAEVIDKAGVTRGPYEWWIHLTKSWMQTPNDKVFKLNGTQLNADHSEITACKSDHLHQIYLDYIQRNKRANESFFRYYDLYQNVFLAKNTLFDRAYAAWVLLQASEPSLSQQKVAFELIDSALLALQRNEHSQYWLNEQNQPLEADTMALLLLALCESNYPPYQQFIKKIAVSLLHCIDSQGGISACMDQKPKRLTQWHDPLPGIVLLALHKGSETGLINVKLDVVKSAVRRLLHRLRHYKKPGEIHWTIMALASWAETLDMPECPEAIISLTEDLIKRQNVTGGFITDYQTDAEGYSTAFYVHSVAVSAVLLQLQGQSKQAIRHLAAAQKGLLFLQTLTVCEQDRCLFPNAAFARGAVKQSVLSQTLDIRYTLAAAESAYAFALAEQFISPSKEGGLIC